MKLVINKCYGGFGLSPTAIKLYLKKVGKKCYFYKQTKYKFKEGVEEHTKITLEEAEKERFVSVYTKDMGKKFSEHTDKYYWYEDFYEKRDDKLLIETIEELGPEKASGKLAEIVIVEIPDDVEWELDEYDGIESIHEQHRSW